MVDILSASFYCVPAVALRRDGPADPGRGIPHGGWISREEGGGRIAVPRLAPQVGPDNESNVPNAGQTGVPARYTGEENVLKSVRSKGKVTFVVAALAAFGVSTASAEELALRVSTGFPSVHSTVTEIMLPWLDALSEQSGVEIKPTLFAAGSSLGRLDRQLDQVQNGLVDAAMGLSVVPRGRMPNTELGDIPFLTKDSRTLNEALSSLADSYLAPDYKGLKLVNVFVDCSVLHTVDTPVTKLEDIKGLRIRVPSALGAELVKAVGGVPVTMPQSEIYESLQRNVIDGAITPWDVISSLKLGEVLDHHTDNFLFCGQLWFAFNQRKFEALPDAVKTTFDEINGAFAIDLAQAAYSKARETALAEAHAKGAQFHTLSPEDMAEWKALVQPAVDAYVADYEARYPGVAKTKAALDEAIEKYSGQ